MKKRKFAITLLILLLMFTSAILVFLPRPVHVPFDSSVWKNGGEEVRATMIRDLVDSRALLGANKEIVLEVLGKADYEQNSTTGSLKQDIWYYGKYTKGTRGLRQFKVIFEGDPPTIVDYGLFD